MLTSTYRHMLLQSGKVIPHVPQTAMLDELHPQNNEAAAHHQVQDATHCPPATQHNNEDICGHKKGGIQQEKDQTKIDSQKSPLEKQNKQRASC